MAWITVEVDVDVDDVIGDLTDKQVEELYRERFKKNENATPDLPSLYDYAAVTDRMDLHHGLDWLNRWLAPNDLALESRRK